MDGHMDPEPPINPTTMTWLRDDFRLIQQIKNSIESEILGSKTLIDCSVCKTPYQLD